MSLRESAKQWWKQAKDDAKAFFKHKDGDKVTSRPHAHSSNLPRTSSTALTESGDNQGAKADPQIDTVSNVGNAVEESPQVRPGMEGTTPSAHGISFRTEHTGGVVSAGPATPQSQVMKRITAVRPNETKSNTSQSVDRPASDTNDKDTSEGAPRGKRQKVVATGLLSLATDGLNFGPIHDMINLLEGIARDHIMEGSVKQEFDLLLGELRAMLKVLEDHRGESVSRAVESEIQDMHRFVERELGNLVNEQREKQGGRYRMAEDNEGRLLSCRSQVRTYMDKLLIGTRMEVIQMKEERSKSHIKVNEVEERQLKTQDDVDELSRSVMATNKKIEEEQFAARIDRLSPSPSPWYKSSEGQGLQRRECTPGTRTKVLASLLEWAGNSSTGGVYWLNGMAGTGKTTIAYSVCKELDKNSQLAASFFCSRLRQECRNVNLIFPSIAYQLAKYSPEFRSQLSIILYKDQDVHLKVLDEQFEALIRKPLLAILAAMPSNFDQNVVIVDALDECDNKGTTKAMLDILLSKTADLPIKFIVSSRPKPQIRDQMTEDRVRSRLVLHELDTGEVHADIATYLREELKPMCLSREELDPWIRLLVEKAGILFIYAATAVRYIGFDNFQRNPASRLRNLLGGPQRRKTTQTKEIDLLYTTILEAAVSEEGLEEEDVADMRQVLYSVICAREPLSVKGLSELLLINDLNRVRGALRPLWSVLRVVGESEVVTTLHASFPDFMFDLARSGTYHCDYKAYNHELAGHCLERIKRTDRQFNICGLESSYLLDQNVPDIKHRVINTISSGLLYACRYWTDHIKEGHCASSVSKQLRELLSLRLLLWMEVLNLSKQAALAGECMKLTAGWCRELPGEEELVELAEDARRFVDMFISNPVSQSTPHIYVSMLAFWPSSAPVAKYYGRFTQGPVQPEGTALDRRQLAHLSKWELDKSIWSVTMSPDGLYIALILDEDVLVLNSSNGEVIQRPIPGHSEPVNAIAFSPDGSRILCGGFESGAHSATIIGWDVRKGDMVLGPFELVGHTGSIYCLTFSPDGACAATGSDDKTMRVWDGNTGTALHLLEAQGTVHRLAFSPDGKIIAASLKNTFQIWSLQTQITTGIAVPTHTEYVRGTTFLPDSTHIIYSTDDGYALHVWNAQTGDMVPGPIQGHTDRVGCIGCSSDGRYIVSGSDDQTVRLWDAQNGDLLLGPLKGHKSYVTSVTFSPDSSRIISACARGLVCTWDARQRNLIPAPTQSPSSSDPITCVKFSSDGTRFVSGSQGGTISIWDAHTGEMIAGPIKPHSEQINAVDFVGDHVVSGSDDGTICVCDARSGEVVLGPLELGSGHIYSVAYSPDGELIATGSYERIDVWNAEDGSRFLGPLTDLQGGGESLQFSPDGTRIVANSYGSSSNIGIWDVSGGTSGFGTLSGLANSVMSISYSPDGALIASGSRDNSILMWDAYTGEMALGPLTGHSDHVRSITFSPESTRLVSGSHDGTIRIWDVETGEMMFELLHGHEGWIKSVAYSPDGTRILSLSEDGSVRIHDAQSPEERAKSRSASDIGDWTMNEDGWVVDDQSRLLVWVPGDLRPALMWPNTLQVKVPPPPSDLRLKFDKSRIGESWQESYASNM